MSLTQKVNAKQSITYTLSFEDAKAHYVQVTMDLQEMDGEFTDVKMPVWAPGSYLVREFARNVDSFKAKDAQGNTVKSEKISKNTWRVYHPGINNLQISYRVYAFELTVRTSFVDESHAYLNGTSIFMYVDKKLDLESTIKIIPHPDWKKISTGLEPVKPDPFVRVAPNYDILADSPIEIGNQDIIEFTASGVKHYVAMVGPGNYDRNKIIKDFTKIVEESTSVFGTHPCKEYTFIVHNVPAGGGGLEHLNSTTVQIQRFAYGNERSYHAFLALIAHEYFHLWNVKRLRPIALGPFDYDNENYTRMLWMSEGFTAFYDNWLVRRSGFYSVDRYLEIMATDISMQTNLPGDRVQPLSESSWDAWIKYYRRNENSFNTQVSYYDKGSLAACLLNLMILSHSGGKQNLDDLMSYLYQEYYQKKDKGFTDAEFKQAAEKFCGKNLDAFYADFIEGTARTDYAQYLALAGLKLTDLNAGKIEVSLSIKTSLNNGKLMVTAVTEAASGYKAGLNVNDEIIAIDGFRTDDVSKMIADKKAGDEIILLISRDGMVREIPVVLENNKDVKYKIEKLPKVTPLQDAVYKGWMEGVR